MNKFKENIKTCKKNIYYIFSRIWHWDRSIIWDIAIYSILYALSPFIWIFVPKLLIDELLGQGNLQKIVFILIGTLIFAGIVHFFIEVLMGSFRMKMNGIRYKFNHMLGEHSMTMPFHYTEDTDTLDKLNTAENTIGNPHRGVGAVITKSFSIVGALIGMIGFILVITNLSVVVLFVLLLTVSLSYVVTVKVNAYEFSRREELSNFRRKSRYASMTMNDFQYGKDIRIYGLKSLLLSKKAESDLGTIGITKNIQWYKFRGALIEAGLFLIKEGIIYIYLVISVIDGAISVGDFVMYTVAVTSFATWLETLLKDLAEISINCQRVDDFKDFMEIGEDETSGASVIPDFSTCEIEFDNISFKYPNSDRYIFKDFTLKIKKGERLALVGINGAGKTTLVKLMTGLYQPTKGVIRIDGVDVSKYDKQAYWDLFSVVFQDVHIFPFSVKENIAFSETYDELKIRYALEHSGLLSKVESLKDGGDSTMLKVLDENGIELSGGENQKLATARALYKSGRVLVMDEPTAALDPIAENELYQRFDEMINQRTAVYISHRLSSTKFCDSIAYIEDGVLLEYGTHENLMEKQGAYARLFGTQARYYQDHSNDMEVAYE